MVYVTFAYVVYNVLRRFTAIRIKIICYLSPAQVYIFSRQTNVSRINYLFILIDDYCKVQIIDPDLL